MSDKPIKAVIYSHSHPDHISGVRAILDPADLQAGRVQLYAHERLLTGIRGNPSLGLMPPLRLAYTFGLGLERGPEGWVETGLGTQFATGTTGFLAPTTTFHGTLDIEVAGIRVHLHEAPSESDDEIVVWFPDHGVLDVVDVIQGESLPNLYALRGAVRDPLQWMRAVDLLRGFGAQALIFGHGRPLVGQDEVRELLTSYRDAIQYIHDQTVRRAACGLTPDELVEQITKLPPRLRDHPWLGEFYGTVTQTVRQIYPPTSAGSKGPNLYRPAAAARAVRPLRRCDGWTVSGDGKAQQAQSVGDFRWVAEILTHLLRLDSEDQDARQLKADALRQLGYQFVNPIWRNNYLMGAQRDSMGRWITPDSWPRCAPWEIRTSPRPRPFRCSCAPWRRG